MYEKELKAMIRAAKIAEKHILKIYSTNFEVEIKSDDSPVTEADKGADKIIREELGKEFPEYGFLTEESKDTGERFAKEDIFIVDPVDGTKDFVARDGQFCTNIALAHRGEVVAGVINLPAQGRTYFASKGNGAFAMEKDGTIRPIHVSDRKSHLRSLRSISFFNEAEKEFYATHASSFEGEAEPVGAAYKFCLIADGSKDFFVRKGAGTKEWDVAAGDIILSEAGGIMVQPDGAPFRYNRHDVYNRQGYVMANCRENLFLGLK